MAIDRCHEEMEKPSYQRNPLMYARDFADCVLGLVSEECGGNPIDRKALQSEYPEMSREPDHVANDPESLLKQGKEAWASGKYELAIDLCTAYLRHNSLSFSAHVWRAHSFHALERYEEAAGDWARNIVLSPEREISYFHLGENLYYLGQFEEAIDAYNRAEARFPDFNASTIKWYRAVCFIEMEKFAEAKADIDRLPTDKNFFKMIRADLLKRMSRDY